MTSPIEIILSTTAKLVVEQVRELLPSNSRRLDEQWKEILEELVFEIQGAVRELAGAGKVIAGLEEREACALIRRIGTEATQATTKERVRLLAHAFAGLLSPDFDAEMRSRASRAFINLEPSDVVALRRALATKPSNGENRPDGWMEVIPEDRAYEGLLHAGCMAMANVFGGGVYVTKLGRAVATCLELWTPDH